MAPSNAAHEDRKLPDHLGRRMVPVTIAMGIYRGEPILTVLQFALVLTVAAIFLGNELAVVGVEIKLWH